MIDGNAHNFLEKLYYEDHYVIFNQEKYLINGCQSEYDTDGNRVSVSLEVYNLTKKHTVFSVTKLSDVACINAFEKAPIWNGKAFWDEEVNMWWVDE